MKLDIEFWNGRYLNGQTGWDIGRASRPMTEFIDTLTDRSTRILIPGCGNAYEAEYLHDRGFANVHLIDLAPLALQRFADRVPGFPKENLIKGDFFAHSGNYDLILEQTFFCAIDPGLRPAYASKISELLVPGGRLAGVLFRVPLYDDHPPFGGNAEEYHTYFEVDLEIMRMEPCRNSIEPRQGDELWVEMMKR